MKPPPTDYRHWLKTLRNSFADEYDLQDHVQRILIKARLKFVREARLTKGERIDFIVNDGEKRIGIECKIRPGGMAVWRQLARYADYLDELILISTGPVGRPLNIYDSKGAIVPLEIYELWKNL